MILTLTPNPALDVYSRTPKLEPQEKLRCERAKIDPGGGGINVSRVIKRLGGNSVAIYSKGGHTGELFQKLLRQEEIEQVAVLIKDDLRQNFAISEIESGNLFRFGFPGPVLEESEYEELLHKISRHPKAEYLVASGSLPPGVPTDFYARAAAAARKINCRFVLDTSGKAYQAVLEEGAYLLKPNKKELEDLVGYEAADEKEQKDLLLEVLDKYNVEVLVLSLGPKGALLATKAEVKHFPAPCVEHISSIGAGDSMVAGMVYSLYHQKTIEKAVLFGIACGSATIKSPGTELLQKKDVEMLYKQLLEQNQMTL